MEPVERHTLVGKHLPLAAAGTNGDGGVGGCHLQLLALMETGVWEAAAAGTNGDGGVGGCSCWH